MTGTKQVEHDLACLSSVRANVKSIHLRGFQQLAGVIIALHRSNPVAAARIADEMVRKTDTELRAITIHATKLAQESAG